MYITHTNSVYTESITLIEGITYPQYVHQISDGGMAVARGIKTMPAELIKYVLDGKYNASDTTLKFIHNLTNRKLCKVGLILACGGQTWSGYAPDLKVSSRYPTFKIGPLAGSQVYAGYLANQLGTTDYITTDGSSCISGHAAWYNAINLLKLNALDAVVVVAVDNGLAEEYLSIFGQYGLSKLHDEEQDPSIVKFRLGQGCNITVFESDTLIQKTNHTPLANVLDMCITAESHSSPMGISTSGEGYSKAINGVTTVDIDFVKTHSTFSTDNKIEEYLIQEKFGRIRTVNYKLRIGHTMGASTAIETALAIQEESGTFLSLGAGMGNAFSSATIEII